MEIRQLMYLVQVAKEKSFTIAAHKLHVSQPALSKMIKNLEEELGVSLFDHSKRNPELTDIGEHVVEESIKILESVENLTQAVEDTINLKKGHVTVGIPPAIITIYFPKIISEFRSTFPDIKFTLVEVGAAKVQEKLWDGEIDIGIVILPVDEKKFDVYPLIQDQSVLIVHKDHPLASKQKVFMEELKEEKFIILDESYMLYHHILLACRKAGFEPKVDFMTSQWDLIVKMVSYNQGISVLPRPILEEFRTPLIKKIPIDDPMFKWRIVIVLKKERYVTFAMREFIRFVQKSLSREKELYNG